MTQKFNRSTSLCCRIFYKAYLIRYLSKVFGHVKQAQCFSQLPTPHISGRNGADILTELHTDIYIYTYIHTHTHTHTHIYIYIWNYNFACSFVWV